MNRSDPKGLCVTDSQGNFWDTGDDVAYDWGVGDCLQNPEWLSMANAAAPGTVVVNGAVYGTGGDSVSVTDTPDPVPCVSGSGMSVNCSPADFGMSWQIIQQVAGNLQGSDGLFEILALPYFLPAGAAAGGYLGPLLPPLGVIPEVPATFSGVSIAALQQAMSAGGPTTYVVTQISQSINWGRSLWVGVGGNALATAQQYGTGGQFFQANIPTALLNLLFLANLAHPENLGGGISAIQFTPGAEEFISGFFSAVP